ncbi:hypothetical protein MRX96_036989 [Rhipicephalus microplus]
MLSPSKSGSPLWEGELSPIDGLTRNLTEMTWSPRSPAQTPLSTRFVLPLPKSPAGRIMKEEEPSPTIQCCVHAARRALTSWSMLVSGGCEDRSTWRRLGPARPRDTPRTPSRPGARWRERTIFSPMPADFELPVGAGA